MSFVSKNSPLREPPTPHTEALRLQGPSGVMAKYIGRRFTSAELFDDEENDPEDLPFLARIVAHEVPLLIGARLEVGRDSELGPRLQDLLAERLPDAGFEVSGNPSAAMRKYQFFHVSTAAVQDERTGLPMWLELKGDLLEFEGIVAGSPAWRTWQDKYWRARMAADDDGHPWPELIGKMVLQINVATYANIEYPGVGVGFYL